MARVINAASIAEEKVKNGETRVAKCFAGSVDENLKTTNSNVLAEETYKLVSSKWMNSAGRNQLWHDIRNQRAELMAMENAGTAIPPATLAGYFAKLFIDVERTRDELLDVVPFISKVIMNADAQEITELRDWLPYIGKEKVISGANDKFPLIEQAGAATKQIKLYVRAFGWKGSIKSLAFAPINELERVTMAAAIIATDYRNDMVVSPIVGATYGALHAQAADSAGSTFDLKVYNTLRQAYKKLGKLKHPMYTNKLIANMPDYANVSLLYNPLNGWDIERIVSGFTGGGFVQDVRGLPIKNLIPYAGGIQNGETYMGETLSLPGPAENAAFLFIPNQSVVVDKRDVTYAVGNGSILEGGTEERGWHRISGVNNEYLLGGCASNTGFGSIIKVALPTE